MNPLVSWACFLAIAGVAYLYYTTQGNKNAPQRGRSATASSKDSVQWSDGDSKKKAAPKPAKAKAPRKSVKKAVQEAGSKAEAYISGASSNAGADADDDLSPVASPALGATTKSPSGRDVSDMLEPKAAAPAILKIGASEKPAREPKQQQKRAETPTETKKQRQNKKKAEEAKAQREADEKQRQALLEKQRRTAREARGEPARNGVQPAKAPASNAWTTVGSSGAAPASANNGQLLDTFEQDVASTAKTSATNGTAPTSNSLPASGQWQNLPSEEEQLRLAMEESAWTTVPKGKKQQRKVKTGDDTAEEGSDSGVPQEAAPVKAAPAPVPAKKAENSKPASRFEVLSQPVPNVGHPLDSDWPVL
ncbi:hypothetical protein BS50DRAFT_582439 [Corynespora cassiicola Philippines]|uniref:Uncharacterized protein n=1 Tax=Corynespora cassiicola Philippines TaxID=1448308 RepID=A0A2T2P559_CORCC|nr:hypothetical protein BS50DRAFT_582439 [Corynespora cassiicola Philippines]